MPEAVDDYVGAESPVRFMDAFVKTLDLRQLGFEKAVAANTGRPPYHPGDLLRLYIYGYLHRLRSSRLLEKECHKNLEVIWLLRTLKPDFKTIADFRKDNKKPLHLACRTEPDDHPGTERRLDGRDGPTGEEESRDDEVKESAG